MTVQAEHTGLVGAVVATSGETVTTRAPFDGTPVAQLPLSTEADVETAFARAREAQRSWAARPIAERARVLLRLHDLVLARQDEVLDLVQAETGKARRHAPARCARPAPS